MKRGQRRAIASGLLVTGVVGFATGWTARSGLSAGDPPALTQPMTELVDAASAAAPDPRCPAPRPLSTIPRKGRLVALTFDDGPDPVMTDLLLDVLAAKGVNATFFETGERAARYPHLVAAAAREGHVIGSHTWDHPRLTDLDDAAIATQLRRSARAIEAATKRPVCLMRPPYGISDARVDAAISRARMTKVMWTRNTMDWESPGVDRIVQSATWFPDGAAPIVLLHTLGRENSSEAGRADTVTALPLIIDRLRARGYAFVQVDGRPFPAAGGRS